MIAGARWRTTIGLLVLGGLLFLPASSLAAEPETPKPAPSIETRFDGYQRRLSQAADELLARTVQAPEVFPSSRTPAALSQPSATPGAYRASDAPAELPPSPGQAVIRVRQLRPTLEPILLEEGLPADLTAVALVESGGRPAALSSKGARGLWQLMPETARRYGLTVNQSQDERLDIRKSTRAAAQYLRELYARFGDWPLALAAYNAGEQTVQRALDRAGPGDFLRLSRWLPSETRQYVPAVMNSRWFFAGRPWGDPAGAQPVLYAPAGAGD